MHKAKISAAAIAMLLLAVLAVNIVAAASTSAPKIANNAVSVSSESQTTSTQRPVLTFKLTVKPTTQTQPSHSQLTRKESDSEQVFQKPLRIHRQAYFQ